LIIEDKIALFSKIETP